MSSGLPSKALVMHAQSRQRRPFAGQLWGTALHVFDSARRSGVNIDASMYSAMVTAATRSRAARAKSVPSRLRGGAPVPEAIVVPSLGSFASPRKVPASAASVPTTLFGRPKTPPLGAAVHVPSLGDAPRKDVGGGGELRVVTPLGMPTVPAFVPALILPLPTPRPKSPPRESSTLLPSAPTPPKKITLDLSFVKLPPKPMPKPVPKVAAPTMTWQSPEDQVSVKDYRVELPSEEVTSTFSVVELSSSAIAETVIAPKADPFWGPRPNAVPKVVPKPSVVTPKPSAAVPEVASMPKLSFEDISAEWERRREAEAKAQEEAEKARALQAEEERIQKELTRKNVEWASRLIPSTIGEATKAMVPAPITIIMHGPTFEQAYAAFEQAKLNPSRVVAENAYRFMIARLNMTGGRMVNLDKVTDIVKDEGFAKAFGNEAERAKAVYSSFPSLIGQDERIMKLYAQFEQNKWRLPKPFIRSVLGAAFLTEGWQRTLEIFNVQKSRTRDPFCFLEIALLQAVCILKPDEAKTVKEMRSQIVRNVHRKLRASMNDVGKHHTGALIRAYQKIRDYGTATSLFKQSMAGQKKVDQALASAYVQGSPPETVREILAEISTPYDADLIASAMLSFVARNSPEEALTLYADAKSTKGLSVRGTRIGEALVMCLMKSSAMTREEVQEVHRVLLTTHTYNSRKLGIVIPKMQALDMHEEIVAAFDGTPRGMRRQVGADVVAAYTGALKALGQASPKKETLLELPQAIAAERETPLPKAMAKSTQRVAADKKSDDPKGETTNPVIKATSETQIPPTSPQQTTAASDEYSTVLLEHAKVRNWEAAAGTLQLMISSGTDPTIFHYNCLLSAATEDTTVVDTVFEYMCSRNVVPNVTTLNSIMNSRIRVNMWERALAALSGMPTELRDVSTYTMALNAISKSEGTQWESAVSLLREMNKRNIKPTTLTYTMGINAVYRTSWQHALKLLQQMNTTKGIEVKAASINKVVLALEDDGRADVAELVRQKIKTKK